MTMDLHRDEHHIDEEHEALDDPKHVDQVNDVAFGLVEGTTVVIC